MKQALGAIAYKHASAIFAWAEDTNNTTVLEQVNFKEKQIGRLNDQLIIAPCQNIYDLTKKNLSELANYGLNETSLAQLAAAIQAFKDALPSSSKGLKDRKSDTKKWLLCLHK